MSTETLYTPASAVRRYILSVSSVHPHMYCRCRYSYDSQVENTFRTYRSSMMMPITHSKAFNLFAIISKFFELPTLMILNQEHILDIVLTNFIKHVTMNKCYSGMHKEIIDGFTSNRTQNRVCAIISVWCSYMDKYTSVHKLTDSFMHESECNNTIYDIIESIVASTK